MIDPGQPNFAGGRKRGMQSDPAGEPAEHVRRDRIEQGAFEVGAERQSVFILSAIQLQRKGFSFAVNCFVPQERTETVAAKPAERELIRFQIFQAARPDRNGISARIRRRDPAGPPPGCGCRDRA